MPVISITFLITTLITYVYFNSYTKASLVASIIFVLDKKTDIISAPHALVYFGIVIFFVYFKVSFNRPSYLLRFLLMDYKLRKSDKEKTKGEIIPGGLEDKFERFIKKSSDLIKIK